MVEGSYKIFNAELKQAGYVLGGGSGEKHLYMGAVFAVPRENQAQNAYKSWLVLFFQGIINDKKYLGY